MAGYSGKIWINDNESYPTINDYTTYTITSTGLQIDNDTYWTYSGSNTFLGFSQTQNATTPDANFAVGSSGSVENILNGKHLYSVEGIATPTPTPILSIEYKNNEIFSTSTPGTKTIKTAGKWMEDDLDVTVNSGMQITATVTVDTGSTVTATKGSTTVTGTSVNNQCVLILPSAGTWTLQATLNGDTTGTQTITFSDNYPVTLQYVQLISFQVSEQRKTPFTWETYQAEEGMTFGDFINSAYNVNNILAGTGGHDPVYLKNSKGLMELNSHFAVYCDTIIQNNGQYHWDGSKT